MEGVLTGHSFQMSAISWSPDDSLLLSSAEHEVRLWDVQVCATLERLCPTNTSVLEWSMSANNDGASACG